LVDLSDGTYRVGERWAYRTGQGVIVHVRVDGLRRENPGAPGGVSDTIEHIPFAEQAVHESVTTRLAVDVPVVGQSEGYEEWRRAFDDGEAGIWGVTVADAVAHIADAFA
jgi:hypothetical protein